MHRLLPLIATILLVLAACNKASEGEGSDSTRSAAENQAAEESEESTEAQPATEGATEPEAQPNAEPFEGVRNGRFESDRFNIRFTLPQGWQFLPDNQTEDSVTLDGPDGLQMVVANTQSIQLADTNFSQLNDRVSFDQVNIVPDRTDVRPINGFPGYRVEGDALLRGDEVPIYFISQALNLPGDPVMITIYIPGDYYDLHSEVMKAVLDSIEALNIRPE